MSESAKPLPAATPEVDEILRVAARHREAGRLDLAGSALRRVLDADADNAHALVQYGMLCDQAGQHGAAVGSLRRAVAVMQRVGETGQDYFDACRYLVHSLVGLGRHDDAAEALAQPGAALESVEVRRSLAAVHCGLATDFGWAEETARAIDQYRRALALWPEIPGARANLTDLILKTGARSELADFTDAIRPDGLRPFLFIACMPKSGSSFLKTALCAFTGYKEAHLSYAYMQNEQDLHLPHVIAAAMAPTVTQQHCRATEANIQMMQGFGIRPVVLVRDIHDIVASLLDFYDGGAVVNTFFAPFWRELERAERVDLLIDHVLPWYFSFYASWVLAERDGRLEMLWESYDALMADKQAALGRIARFHGLDATEEKLCASVAAAEGDRGGSRFNKGVAGRGATLIEGAQKDRIARLAARYRGVDFSRIGL